MKKSLLGLALLLALARPGRAQRYLSVDEFDAISRSARASRDYQRLAALAQATPELGYYLPRWLPGQVTAADGKSIVCPALRYNLVVQALEVRDSATAAVQVLPAATIAGFTLGRPGKHSVHPFETHSSLTEEGNTAGFFEPLNAAGGGLRLFLFYRIAEVPARRVEALAVEVWPARLTRETNLFVLRPGQARLSQLAFSRGSVLRLFGKQATQVEAYARQRGLNLEDVDGAARAVDYYNTLPH